MTYWEILGITPTNDIREIKSAYARKAKEFNPEEYPEEFKRVHSAYKNACAYAKRQQSGQKTLIVPMPSKSVNKQNDLFEDISSVRKEDTVKEDAEKSEETEEASPYDFTEVMSRSQSLEEKACSSAEKEFKSCAEELRKILDDMDLRRSASVWKNFFAGHPSELFADDSFLDEAESMFNALSYGATFPQQTALVIINGFGGSRRIQRHIFSDRMSLNTNHTQARRNVRNISKNEQMIAAVVVLIGIMIAIIMPYLQYLKYERESAEPERVKTEYSAPDELVPRLALGKWKYELGTLTIRGTTYKIEGNDGSVRRGAISHVELYADRDYETVYLDNDMILTMVTLYGSLCVQLKDENGCVYICTRFGSTESTDAAETE